MSDEILISLNPKQGKLKILPKNEPKDESHDQKLNTIIEQQIQSKYLTLVMILAFIVAFVVLSIALQDIRFSVTLVVLTLIAFSGYSIVNYTEHLSIKYIMDTIRKIALGKKNEADRGGNSTGADSKDYKNYEEKMKNN